MTSAEMLARARTLLDESSASFWTDAEVYAALTDGQKQVANFLMSKVQNYQRLPEGLRPLITSLVSSETTYDYEALPSDFWYDIDLRYGVTAGAKYPAIRRELKDASFMIGNTYLSEDFYYTINSEYINFEAQQGDDHYYTLIYLAHPTDISALVEPILEGNTHSPIVHWAVSQMLLKDQRPLEAQIHLKLYETEIGVIN